jgi:hypothetical protein
LRDNLSRAARGRGRGAVATRVRVPRPARYELCAVAADKLVERAEGKPEQPMAHRVAVPPPIDIDQLTDEQREVLRDILLLAPPPPEAEAARRDGIEVSRLLIQSGVDAATDPR